MISCTSFSQSRNAISRKLGSLTRANQITPLSDDFALFMLIWHVLLLGMLNNYFISWLLVPSFIWFSLNLALYRKIKNITRVNGETHTTFYPGTNIFMQIWFSSIWELSIFGVFFKRSYSLQSWVRAYSPISQNKIGNLDKENG